MDAPRVGLTEQPVRAFRVSVLKRFVSISRCEGMPKGGARRNAGRKPGLRTRLTIQAVELAESTGTTPLAFMLGVMVDDRLPVGTRLQAAGLAAPFVHPRLSASLHGALPAGPGSDARQRLDAMLERLTHSPAPLLELPAVAVDARSVRETVVLEPGR